MAMRVRSRLVSLPVVASSHGSTCTTRERRVGGCRAPWPLLLLLLLAPLLARRSPMLPSCSLASASPPPLLLLLPSGPLLA